jgi:hypothetical protein
MKRVHVKLAAQAAAAGEADLSVAVAAVEDLVDSIVVAAVGIAEIAATVVAAEIAGIAVVASSRPLSARVRIPNFNEESA